MRNEPGRLHVDQQKFAAGLLLVLTIIAVGGVLKITGAIVQPLVIALLILQVVSNGLNLMRVNNFLTIAIWGIILIVVMIANYLNNQYQQKRRNV